MTDETTNEPELRAKAYQKTKQILALVHLLYTPVLLVIAFVTPLSDSFKSAAAGMSANPTLIVILYFIFFSVYTLLLDFPFSVYSGFSLEKKYQLSNQTFRGWLWDFTKRALLSFLIFLPLIAALYWLIRHFPNSWWLLAWAGYAGVTYVIGKLFPVLIVPLFYKYGAVADENLKERILALAKKYDMPVGQIFSINLSRTTKKANAAFMGMGKTKRVVLSDTLLENFTTEEIETVVAHELGHYKQHDIWKMLGFGLVATFILFGLAFVLVDGLSLKLGFEGVADVAALPVLFLVFYLASVVFAPLQNAFSRWAERGADRFALRALRNVEAFISCMTKLGRMNLADPSPNPVYEWFFYDHPSIGRRIAMAKGMKL